MKNKIVLIPFPFDDFSRVKVRPALCLTDPIGKYQHIIIAFISSKIPHEILETDIIINHNSPGFIRSGLRVDSVIKIHKLVTVPKSLIERQLGEIEEQMAAVVREKLFFLFH